jgi:hypothetical protein
MREREWVGGGQRPSRANLHGAHPPPRRRPQTRAHSVRASSLSVSLSLCLSVSLSRCHCLTVSACLCLCLTL